MGAENTRVSLAVMDGSPVRLGPLRLRLGGTFFLSALFPFCACGSKLTRLASGAGRGEACSGSGDTR